MRLQPCRGVVQLGEWRKEDDRAIAAPREEHAVGIEAELEGVFDVRSASVPLGVGVGPALVLARHVQDAGRAQVGVRFAARDGQRRRSEEGTSGGRSSQASFWDIVQTPRRFAI